MSRQKTTIFAIMGSIRRHKRQAFFDKCLSICNRMAASSYCRRVIHKKTAVLKSVVSKPPFGVRFRLGRVNSQPPSNGFFICRWSGGEALYA